MVKRRAFTLIELLIVVSIIAIMAGMVMFALFSAQETAKAQKTKALIVKLDAVIRARYEGYRSVRVQGVPIDEYNACIPNSPNPEKLDVGDFIDLNNDGAPTIGSEYNDSNGDLMPNEVPDFNGNGFPDPGEALDLNGNNTWDIGEWSDINGNGVPEVYPATIRHKMRLDVLRDTMRLELPDRWSDITDDPATPVELPASDRIKRPSVSAGYLRRYNSAATPPSDEYAGAECLYLIIMQAQQEDGDEKSFLKPDQIGDIDGDGFSEILDGWRMPIRFLRWAPGFTSPLQVLVSETATVSGSNVTITSRLLGPDAGAYIGGAIYAEDPAATGNLLPTSAARITRYSFVPGTMPNPGTGTFVISTTGTLPSGRVFVLPADPFDSLQIYRPTMSLPSASFNLYPLIYSPGPNRVYGVLSGYSAGAPLRYAQEGANPFYSLAGREMMGTQIDLPNEPNFVSRGWIDNIHNHAITTR